MPMTLQIYRTSFRHALSQSSHSNSDSCNKHNLKLKTQNILCEPWTRLSQPTHPEAVFPPPLGKIVIRDVRGH